MTPIGALHSASKRKREKEKEKEKERKKGPSKKLHEDRSEEVVEDGPDSRKSVERTGGGCCAYRKVLIEDADGGSSREGGE